DWLTNYIKAKRGIVFFDTCESGALIAGYLRSRATAPASEASVGRLHEATGRIVLTAAAIGQAALGGRISQTGGRHGVFTWALLDALRNGDSNGDGVISLSELVRHVQSLVPQVAGKFIGAGAGVAAGGPSAGQTARLGSRGEDFTFAQKLP